MTKKSTIILTVCLLFLGQFSYVFAQESKPIILDKPSDWRYEKINFPLDFAPDITYKGFEELRFAPGMFDRKSPMYFTYVFVVSIDNKTKIKKKEVNQFLLSYYKGLCNAVAKSKKLTVDTSKIEISLKKSRKTVHSSLTAQANKSKNYDSQVLIFDTFNNGEKVLLNMELEITIDKKAKKAYMLALVSPKLEQEPVWKKLYKIREKVKTFGQ